MKRHNTRQGITSQPTETHTAPHNVGTHKISLKSFSPSILPQTKSIHSSIPLNILSAMSIHVRGDDDIDLQRACTSYTTIIC
jgi:hypothetical protein